MNRKMSAIIIIRKKKKCYETYEKKIDSMTRKTQFFVCVSRRVGDYI